MTLPLSIRKRDGRLEVFEPDRLARSLFAATESLGEPNAFLARELTDGVLHFLANDANEVTASEQLADLTVKVVRELGYPPLARAYEAKCKRQWDERPPQSRVAGELAPLSRDGVVARARATATAEWVRHSLERVYPRDLVSAHWEGLLELLDLSNPFEMIGIVLQGPCPLEPLAMLETLQRSRAMAGWFVAIDGIEYQLNADDEVSRFVETFEKWLGILGFQGILNLNSAEPPAWARTPGGGSLFSGYQTDADQERTDRIALECLRESRGIRVFWHLSARDFRDDAASRLQTVTQIAVARGGVDFVFDHPKRPIVLGPGLARGRQAALGMVAMKLARFVQHLGGGPIDRDRYLRKLTSLARFARSAGHARQEFLRQFGDPRLREGFLLERAVEIVVPVDLFGAAQCVLGNQAESDAVAELARESLNSIRSAIVADNVRITECAIDFPLGDAGVFLASDLPVRKHAALLAGLQKAADGGVGTISLKRNTPDFVKEIPDLLRTAWKQDAWRIAFAFDP